MMSIELNKPLHLSMDGISKEAYDAAFKRTVGSGGLYFYDHFGSLESENLVSKLKYLATGIGCDFIILDHISIAVSGIEDGDERRIIDNLMTKLRSLCENTQVGIIAVCHLKKKMGQGATHEEGGRVTLDDLRGSGGIKQMSDTIIGMERDQQDEEVCNISQLRVLKCRFTGVTGPADMLEYDKKSGRLLVQNPITEEFRAELAGPTAPPDF
jgi:twinkle protein